MNRPAATLLTSIGVGLGVGFVLMRIAGPLKKADALSYVAGAVVASAVAAGVVAHYDTEDAQKKLTT